MIKITLKNGIEVEWKEYDDYKYDGKCFIVKAGECTAFYNMDAVISAVVKGIFTWPLTESEVT